MADCELLGGCIFFNDKMGQMPEAAELLKKHYCRSNNAECARYMIFKALGRPAVPPDLFPNRVERARALLEKAGRAS